MNVLNVLFSNRTSEQIFVHNFTGYQTWQKKSVPHVNVNVLVNLCQRAEISVRISISLSNTEIKSEDLHFTFTNHQISVL